MFIFLRGFVGRLIKEKWLIKPFVFFNFIDGLQKEIFLFKAVNYIFVAGNRGEKLPLVFFEFGCHSGRTFSVLHNSFSYFGKRFSGYAFDSFKGLPSTSSHDGIFEEGEYSTSRSEFERIIRKKTGSKLGNVSIIEGFYADSLTEDLQANLPDVGLVHIDVDLYSSCASVLNFVEPKLCHGSVVLFDDWYTFLGGDSGGEALALADFESSDRRVKFKPWCNYGAHGKAFFVVVDEKD